MVVRVVVQGAGEEVVTDVGVLERGGLLVGKEVEGWV